MEEKIPDLYSESYFLYLQKRSPIRKLIRKLYLRDIKKYCIGKTIDFGCGIGELVKMLPEGSLGLEVNKVLVEKSIGLNVPIKYYDVEKDQYDLIDLPAFEFTSFCMNHVLEHLENSAEVAEKLFTACHRLGIKRIVFTVPGMKGFHTDKTHRTFIDETYLQRTGLLINRFYKIRKIKYYPFNIASAGRFFTHNEMRIIFDERKD